MKKILMFTLFIVLLGIMGRMECQDAIRSAEYDAQNKQEVIKQWEVRCASGDIFDKDICQAIMK
jgi:hypothetical protein